MTNILCSSGVYLGDRLFQGLGQVRTYQDGTLEPSLLDQAEILITRSQDRIDSNLLSGSRVRFVGSATTGNDHLDISYLQSQEIHFYNAAGCNANSVAEYVTAALIELSASEKMALSGHTIGIIGFGNIGTNLAEKARHLGLKPVINDPPRQSIDGGDFYVGLDELLRVSDIITLHVPLNRSGPYSTVNLADRNFFERLNPGCTFINTSRGAVVDSGELLRAIEKGIIRHSVIDTWESEPGIRRDLLERVTIGTPHIAGHSMEGKLAGTVRVYLELCDFLGCLPEYDYETLVGKWGRSSRKVIAGDPGIDTLNSVVKAVYSIRDDSMNLKDCLRGEIGSCFSRLRRNYPQRREFKSLSVAADNEGLKDTLKGLGFNVS